jgi:hypothetical protein
VLDIYGDARLQQCHAGRDNMTKYDGLLDSLDRVEEVLVGLNA